MKVSDLLLWLSASIITVLLAFIALITFGYLDLPEIIVKKNGFMKNLNLIAIIFLSFIVIIIIIFLVKYIKTIILCYKKKIDDEFSNKIHQFEIREKIIGLIIRQRNKVLFTPQKNRYGLNYLLAGNVYKEDEYSYIKEEVLKNCKIEEKSELINLINQIYNEYN